MVAKLRFFAWQKLRLNECMTLRPTAMRVDPEAVNALETEKYGRFYRLVERHPLYDQMLLFNLAVDRFPENRFYNNKYLATLIEAGRFEEAILYFEEMPEEMKDEYTYDSAGAAYNCLERFRETVTLFASLISERPDIFDNQLLGRYCFALNALRRFQETIDVITKYQKPSPIPDAFLTTYLAQAFYGLRGEQTLVKAWNLLKSISGYWITPSFNTAAAILLDKQMNEKALLVLQQLGIEFWSRDSYRFYCKAARRLDEQNKTQEHCIDALKRLEQFPSSCWDIYNYIDAVNFNRYLQRYEKSYMWFCEAYQKNPKHRNLCASGAETMLILGKADRIIQAFSQLIEWPPQVKHLAVKAYLAIGKNESVTNALKILDSKDSNFDHEELPYLRVEALWKLDKKREALRYLANTPFNRDMTIDFMMRVASASGAMCEYYLDIIGNRASYTQKQFDKELSIRIEFLLADCERRMRPA